MLLLLPASSIRIVNKSFRMRKMISQGVQIEKSYKVIQTKIKKMAEIS